jgi:putative transposase
MWTRIVPWNPIRLLVTERAALVAENLALRQQLAVLQRSVSRPRLRRRDRIFWVWLSCLWTGWRSAVVIVQPDTVVRWHRQGFRLYWRWKSRRRGDGRPAIPREVRDLVRRMAQANLLWGAPRIHGEMLKLGIEISQAAVAKYMPRRRKPPSPTWRAFLKNHISQIVAVDFFTVPTVTLRVLFVFIVLAHDRRRVLHFNVTEHPTATWTGQQIREAFPWDTTPRFLLRDRDGIYGDDFVRVVRSMGIEQVLTAARSPWQNPYAERVIGSIRRECLDHVIVLNERHLRRVLREYFAYYHRSRTHLSLAKDAPEPREIEPSERGEIVEVPEVGGLHHRYLRRAA